MTPQALADLSARAYRHMRPWTAAQFAATLGQPHALLVSQDAAFVLGQVIVDEAEILALASAPDQRRQGLASGVLRDFLAQAQARGATRVFLETVDGNDAALAFYQHHGFVTQAVRPRYYPQPGGKHADALIMARALP